MKRSRLRVKSQIERTRRKRKLQAIVLAVLLVLILAGLIWVLNAEAFQVSQIEVSNDTSIESELIERKISDEMKERYFFIVPKSNTLFLPERKISRLVYEQSAEVESVQISRSGLTKIDVAVKKRTPYVIWCREKNPNECYFADKKAFIFKEAPVSNLNLFPTFYGNIKGKAISKVFMETADFRSAIAFFEFLENELGKVDYIAPEGSDLKAVLVSGAIVLFDPMEVEEAAQNIAALVESPDLGGENFDISNTEYIDLRYGSKIFWKPKEVE